MLLTFFASVVNLTDSYSTNAPAMALKQMMEFVLRSPLYTSFMVPLARQMMVKTAEDNAIPWGDSLNWIKNSKVTITT